MDEKSANATRGQLWVWRTRVGKDDQGHHIMEEKGPPWYIGTMSALGSEGSPSARVRILSTEFCWASSLGQWFPSRASTDNGHHINLQRSLSGISRRLIFFSRRPSFGIV
ncbi:hypothetical protein E2C01_064434 [Portunus trituberculatus]|uniref:Uncharacterized protein n=1 Tax=Portunus trituberculatus TaxID=210409 RepID=A0A5B7HG67_PORTR|nr:hypothetical protein [Portunus trituberculatus]